MKTLVSFLTIVLILTIPSRSLAQQVVPIAAGTPAPYSGILMPEGVAKEAKNAVIERDTYKSVNESLNKSLNLSNQNFNYSENKVNILLEQNDKLAKNLQAERTVSDFQKIMWFGLGVLATGAAAYVGSKIAK